jgi:hypothetical protein
MYSFFDVQLSSHTRRKGSSSQSGKDHLLLNKFMMVAHISSWIIKVFAPCLLLMGDTLRNTLLDRVSMQFFLSLSSIHFFFFSFKMLYKTWTHKSYIKGFSFTTYQVGQQWVSLGDMTLDREKSQLILPVRKRPQHKHTICIDE